MKIFFLIALLIVLGGGYFYFFSSKDSGFDEGKKNINVSSTAFQNDQEIPTKYTCEGENINPDLILGNIPPEAKSLLLIMNNQDVEKGVFTHWIVWNINPKTTEIKENFSSITSITGKNDFGSGKYEGPCPPYGKHTYFFKVYALDKNLELENTSGIKEVIQAAQKHVMDSGEISGFYVTKLK